VAAVAGWDDVARIALALPDTFERESRGTREWRARDGAKDRAFVWERPLRRSDLDALGPTAPTGPVLGARTPHLEAKEALLAADAAVYFTTPHFDGYKAILVRLAEISVADLEELITEAWLCTAPKKLAQRYSAESAEGAAP
jgi:hypothetical protein